MTRDTFQDLVKNNAFIEHAQFGGNCYGTSKKAVKDVAEKERICILDIEMEVWNDIRNAADCMGAYSGTIGCEAS